ncbi:MAG: hypothetical protein JJ979_11945 [Roseibium sp.]|nr:hypothetical protein [Roseibium sp.]
MKKQPPIHVFKSDGMSVLTASHQEERIRQLETENARLKRLIKAQRVRQERFGDLEEEKQESSTLH